MDNETKFTKEQFDSVKKEIEDNKGNLDINAIMQKHLDEGQRQAVQNLLSDPQRLQSIINSPLAKAFMERFERKKRSKAMDFGSLNMENIENILGSMSSEDMEMLKNAAESIFSSQVGANQQTGTAKREEKSKSPSGGIDLEVLSSVMSVMEKINSQPQDPRCNLLLSLKPMVSAQRRDKIDEAVKIMSLLSLIPIIDELRGL